MSDTSLIKQFLKFDRSVFPPASAPFRRGLAAGGSIGASVAVVLFAVLWVGAYLRAEAITFMVIHIVLLAGLPWSALLNFDSSFPLLGVFACMLINVFIFGIIVGAMAKMRS